MPMLTLRRLVKKLRRAVIREFIRACHLGVLDDDRIGFAIQRAIMQMSADGFTGVWLPTLRRTARREPPRRGSMPRRTRAPAVAVVPPSSTPVEATPTSTPQSSLLYAKPQSLPPPPSCRRQPRQQRRGLGGGHLRLRCPDLADDQPWRLGRAARRSSPTPWSIPPRLPRSRCRPPRFSRHDAMLE
jgi:hypothetical protein